VSFFVTLTRLAVGLEAKKSSAYFTLRPVFYAVAQNFGFPAPFENFPKRPQRLNCLKQSTKMNMKKARVFYD
jgi:hypothetical protein